jgi:hypothetical protein
MNYARHFSAGKLGRMHEKSRRGRLSLDYDIQNGSQVGRGFSPDARIVAQQLLALSYLFGLKPISANLGYIFGSEVNIEYRIAEYRTAEVKKYFEIRHSLFDIRHFSGINR